MLGLICRTAAEFGLVLGPSVDAQKRSGADVIYLHYVKARFDKSSSAKDGWSSTACFSSYRRPTRLARVRKRMYSHIERRRARHAALRASLSSGVLSFALRWHVHDGCLPSRHIHSFKVESTVMEENRILRCTRSDKEFSVSHSFHRLERNQPSP